MNFFKKHKILIILEIISIIVHFRWLSFNIFTFGDWPFSFSPSLEFFLKLSTWETRYGIGNQDFTLWRLPYNTLLGFIGYLGFDSSVADKITVFWPIIFLTPLAGYLFLKRVVRSDTGAFFGTLIIIFNTYFLAITTQGHILLNLAFMYSIFALYFLYRALDTQKLSFYLICSIFLFLSGVIDFRAFYIILWVVFAIGINYIFIEHPEKKLHKSILFWRDLVIGGISLICLNMYWVLVFLSSSSVLDSDALNRGLFGNQFWNLQSAITLFHPFWSGAQPDWFIVHPVPTIFWLLPVFSILGFILNKKKFKNLFIYFIISIVGVLLAKQVAQPFPNIYKWLFDYFPGFKAFREATKFYFLIVIGYSVLIGYFAFWVKKNLTKKVQKIGAFIIYALIIILSTGNAIPILSGSIKTLYIPKTLPGDYSVLKNFLDNQDDYFRTLWVPRESTWSYNDVKHPRVPLSYSLGKELKSILNIEDNSNFDYEDRSNVTSIFSKSFSKEYLDSISVKYVIVPQQESNSDYDFYKIYGGDRNYFVRKMTELPYLKKVDLKLSGLDVFENSSYLPFYNTQQNQFTIDNTLSLDAITNYVKQRYPLNKGLNYSKTKTSNSIYIENLFANKLDKDFTKKLELNKENKNSLVINNEYQGMTYNWRGGRLVVKIKPSDAILIDGKILDGSKQETIVFDKEYPENQSLYLVIDGVPNRLQVGEGGLGLVNSESSIEVYSAEDTNLLGDGDFENQLWSEKVGDCNKYDNDSKISMESSADYSSVGSKSLKLEAQKHIACTSKKVKLKPNSKALLQFDYLSPDSKLLGYNLVLSSQLTNTNLIDTSLEALSLKENIGVEELGKWKSYSKIIDTDSSTTGELYFYAFSPDEQKTSTAYYDNARLVRLDYMDDVLVPYLAEQKYTTYPIPADAQIEYAADKQTDNQNIIQNGDFEDGLWQDKVGDCNNYDENGKISMELDSNNYSNGSKSLKLTTEGHIACTKKYINVKPNTTYLLSLDYQSDVSKESDISINYSDPDQTNTKQTLQIKSKNWNTFSKITQTSKNTSSIELYLSTLNYLGSKESVRYDNIRLFEVPNFNNRYFVISEPPTIGTTALIKTNIISPTKSEVSFKNATDYTNLNMNVYYNPQWQLSQKIDGAGLFSWPKYKSEVRGVTHVQQISSTNSWEINVAEFCSENKCNKNDDGRYNFDVVVEFLPQQWLYPGAFISGATWLIILAYLVYNWRKPKPKSGSKTKLLALDNIALDLPVSYRSIVVIDPPAVKKRYMGL